MPGHEVAIPAKLVDRPWGRRPEGDMVTLLVNARLETEGHHARSTYTGQGRYRSVHIGQGPETLHTRSVQEPTVWMYQGQLPDRGSGH